MPDYAYVEAGDGSAHAPIIGSRYFLWTCVCGAKGRKMEKNRIIAFNRWDDHLRRYERKLSD